MTLFLIGPVFFFIFIVQSLHLLFDFRALIASPQASLNWNLHIFELCTPNSIKLRRTYPRAFVFFLQFFCVFCVQLCLVEITWQMSETAIRLWFSNQSHKFCQPVHCRNSPLRRPNLSSVSMDHQCSRAGMFGKLFELVLCDSKHFLDCH